MDEYWVHFPKRQLGIVFRPSQPPALPSQPPINPGQPTAPTHASSARVAVTSGSYGDSPMDLHAMMATAKSESAHLPRRRDDVTASRRERQR